MVIALVLLVIVIASVLFHLVAPWWTTPLASNWKAMDDTLTITIVITGIFFVVTNLFVVYALWRFRHRTGQRAAYQPVNHKLERWLIGITTIGIVALLAPGLKVYADYVQPPEGAMEVEVLAQQWQWRFRFPGAGGKLGGSDARFFAANNPFGIDPADAAARDDILIDNNELHLPLNKPVKVLLRSHDVLHDFFVPNFRARQNIVPGQISRFWFTPTVPGRYEAMCAQLCGVGHPAMRGFVVVESQADFDAWLAKHPSFAKTQSPPAATNEPTDPLVARGRTLAQEKGCVACHSIDGSAGVGPTWKNLYGKTESLDDGTTAKVDEAFLRGFIRNPTARSIKGFPPVMPQIPLSDDELNALVAHIKSQAQP
jgi:cytochrome c oxidase subunit II